MTTTRKTTLAAALALTLTVSFAAHAQFRDRDRSGDRNDRSRFGDRSQRNGSTNGSSPSTTQPQQSDTGSTRPAEYRERYTILAERNIFLKERRRPGGDGPRRDDGPREPRPEQTFALTGIVEEDGQFRAYFENLRNPSFTRVSLGDPIARGKVTAIALDAVEYEQDGQRRWIEIGHDLTGTRTVAPSSSSTYTSSGASPTTGPTTGPTTATLDFDPNDPALTTEQKMKLKRMKEQGLIK